MRPAEPAQGGSGSARLHICYLIYSWFPFGGQQRDFLRVVNESVRRGHRVQIYTMKWDGDPPEHVNITLVPVKAMSRHLLYQKFTRWIRDAIETLQPDVVVGFNKMPGLDVYFAADPCFAEKAVRERGRYYRFMPRFRHFSAYEEAVFGRGSRTEVLLLSPVQRRQFIAHYPGCGVRLHDIPPGISLDRRAPPDAALIREEFRNEFGFSEQHHVVVQIGSGFVVKGVDRSLRAIAALPEALRRETTYMLVGQDKAARFIRLARRLGISANCIFLGGRSDIPRFLLGADLLIHPAYNESAGYVLLEGTVAGLPVLTTDTCGYAFHIEQAAAGQVCQSPFRQADLNARLQDMLTSPLRGQWKLNGLRYAESADLFSMPQAAVDLIEVFAEERRSHRRNPV